MKLEKLFVEAIESREGVKVDIQKMERLLLSTLEGHLCADQLSMQGPFETLNGKILFEKYAFLEQGIAREMARLLGRRLRTQPVPIDNSSLTVEQRQAVIAGLTHDIVFLTGGPGTGKTYTIAQLLKDFHGQVVVAAPTGKAASHLQAGIEKVLPSHGSIASGTLHSVLGVSNSYDAINKDLFLGADLIIVDECSMIDVTMWYALLRAVSERSKLLLVGDTDQLPPVETGSIFFHLCEYMNEKFPDQCVHLTQCLRSDSTEIIALAEAVNKGNTTKALALLESGNHIGFTSELSFPPFPKDGNPEALFEHSAKYRILSALKEGEYGVYRLNARFSYQYNRGDTYVEPIILTKSSKDLGLFNGENGIAMRYRASPEKDVAFFRAKGGGLISYPLALLPKYELAYALSIHKSQGSEYEHVTLVLQQGAASFGRELLYTGITRAKKSVCIYGKKETLFSCMEKHTIRASMLKNRLNAMEG